MLARVFPLYTAYPDRPDVRKAIDQARAVLEVDLRDLPADLGRFDYIIAHGVYSWIADPLQEKAGFKVLRGNLFDFAIMKTSVISDAFRQRYNAMVNVPLVEDRLASGTLTSSCA